jgi:peroxiredoxin
MNILSELLDDVRFIVQYRKKYVRLQKNLDRQAPKAGDLAPDFSLSDVTGKMNVRLSDFRGKKPVALVFGSYT